MTVRHPNGLHMRPLDGIARIASQFTSEITLVNDSHRADAQSIIEMIGLAADYGSEIVVEAAGDDAVEAVEAIARFIESDAEHEAQQSDSSAS